jgi:hypothetical protein
MKKLLFLLIPILLLACHPPAGVVTEPGKTAFTANEVVLRVNRVMDLAIQLEADKTMPTATAKVIISFCVDADRVLAETPAGWKATVKASWTATKANPIVAPYLAKMTTAVKALDAVLESVL